MDDDWANEMTEQQSQSMRTVLCALVAGLEVGIPWGNNTIQVRMDRHGIVYFRGTVIRLGTQTNETRWIKLDAPVHIFFSSCQKLSQYSMESISADIVLNKMKKERKINKKDKS